MIAEEVAEVFPELVVYNERGEPMTVKYHLLSSMLLNELERREQPPARGHEQMEALSERVAALERAIVHDASATGL